MLTGPGALDGLMFLSSFTTPSVFIFIDGIVDFRFMWVSGMLSTLPLVNTEENCFINICTFSLLWLTIFPFSLKNNNSKPFWKYVKSSKQDNIIVAPLKEKGKLVSHSKEKAQILI
jgi:hypothetical protein